MICAARVHIYNHDPRSSFPLAAQLEARGYRTMRADDLEQARRIAGDEHPDVIIFDAGATAPSAALADSVEAIWRPSGAPVMLVADGFEMNGAANGILGAMTCVLPRDFHESQLYSRLASLVRLNTMREEIARRAETSERYGVHKPCKIVPSETGESMRVLVSCTDGGDRARLEGALDDRFEIQFVEPAYEAIDRLLAGEFEAFVLVTGNDPAEAFAICDRLIHQVGGIIGRLVRGEDLAARFRGDKFVVALPETAAEVAERVVQRIVGVVGNTEFAVADGYGAVHAALKSAVIAFAPVDAAESLIARARAEARVG